VSKNAFLGLAAGSLMVFSTIAWLLSTKVVGISLWVKIMGYQPFGIQLLAGVFSGLLWGYLAKQLVTTAYFEPVSTKFRDILGPMQLNWWEIWIISLCAGIGEELLFRGSVQPLLGVWPTSILFVFLHGYLSPFNLRLSLYGIFMVIVIAVLGYLADFMGLVPAMAAHTLIDVVLLRYLTVSYQPAIREDTPVE